MSQSDTKRGRDVESKHNDDRAVRQRIDTTADETSVALPSSAAVASSFASSSLPSRLSLLGLAVVERQLILQSLDWRSLTRVASTCRQLRVESLHKEVGKFISNPSVDLSQLDRVNSNRANHASPLYRAHVSVGLMFPCPAGRSYAELMAKAALFPRIVFLDAGSLGASHTGVAWTEQRALHLLAQLLQVREVRIRSAIWLRSPAVQHALFGLPALTQLTVLSHRDPFSLIDAAVLRASNLTGIFFASITADHRLRALRLAPALRHIHLQPPTTGSLKRFCFIVPPTLERLTLDSFGEEACGSRATLKAFFTRAPRLQSIELSRCCVESFFQGMLDAGVGALPVLRRVWFAPQVGFDESEPAVEPSLLRRFLHRFPQVTVTISLDDSLLYAEAETRFGLWERVEVKIKKDPPPSPHASDDDEGSEVSELSDTEAANA